MKGLHPAGDGLRWLHYANGLAVCQPMDWHTIESMPMKQTEVTSSTVRAIQKAAKNQKATAYGLAKSTGLRVYTVSRFLAGEGSPTIDTVERIAKALGLVIKVEKP